LRSRRVQFALPAVTIAALAAATVAATVIAPAMAASTSGTKPTKPAAPQAHRDRVLRQGAASPLAGRTALIAPVGRLGSVTPAATGRAVRTCVTYAARAGWPDNGYYGGDLVTAAAICVAESAGNPNLIVCDNKAGAITGQGNYPKFSCPPGTYSYDRGLWQLNTKAASSVSNKCAFNSVCNAGQAYLFSGRGTSFAPWSSYDQDTYAGPFLDLVQAAVTKLKLGTITSALLGECLVPGKATAGSKVTIANCGTGATDQLWSFAGGKLKSGSRCAAITSRSAKQPGVVLESCTKSKAQAWAPAGLDELRNAADGNCLTDPGENLKTGTALDVTRCANAKDQTWWLP
jgi:Ricin-type beta-trefoil lectin domain/Lysozyme like domain